MCANCQNFAKSSDKVKLFLKSGMAAMERAATIGIIKGLSEGSLYMYLMATETRTINKRKNTADSKRVVIGKFPVLELKIAKKAQ